MAQRECAHPDCNYPASVCGFACYAHWIKLPETHRTPILHAWRGASWSDFDPDYWQACEIATAALQDRQPTLLVEGWKTLW